jgi:hypothetical protein
MEKLTTASRAFKCVNGENVTLTFVAHNTDLRITYRIDHEEQAHIVEGNSLTFTVTKELTILRVFFHFINQSGTGGSYDITLTGSHGGTFPDPPPVMQSGILVPIRRYAFVI